MKETLQAIQEEVQNRLKAVTKRSDFESFKASIVGPRGKLTEVVKGMREVPKEEKPLIGRLINETKNAVEGALAEALGRIEQAEREARLGPPIDPTLPLPDPVQGGLHPLTRIRWELTRIFGKLGFSVAEGPEIETEWFCFDALNTPADHPARDEQDTLFLRPELAVANVNRRVAGSDREAYLLRTQTSSVQIRTLLAERPPLRIISPGRVFRRDTVDATHSANFHQLEGLYVDEQVSLADLKAVLTFMVQELFGGRVETRLRPSFFPFTEPSFEMDIRSPKLGRLSDRWIEILGCGMVDPAVFEAVDYDPEVWSGYAFGVGIERIAMILHGIDDIRHFYQNDLRFLRQLSTGPTAC